MVAVRPWLSLLWAMCPQSHCVCHKRCVQDPTKVTGPCVVEPKVIGQLPANPRINLHSDLTSVCLGVTWTSRVISIVQTDALQPLPTMQLPQADVQGT